MSGPDYILNLGGQTHVGPTASKSDFVGRPWIAVRWKCCTVYSRVYRNKEGTAYEGRCPRCGAPVRARVGSGGTDARFFEAG